MIHIYKKQKKNVNIKKHKKRKENSYEKLYLCSGDDVQNIYNSTEPELLNQNSITAYITFQAYVMYVYIYMYQVL